MIQEITTIEFPMKIAGINMGTSNCFLIKADGGFMLIDTAIPNKRAELDKALEEAGCRPGNLKLIVITHADLDHTGNGAYLRKKYGAKIAVHRRESEVVEGKNSDSNRGKLPFLKRVLGVVMLRLLSLFISFGPFEPFSPDVCIDEATDLSAYGFDVKVLHLPGHSKGSIGILTPDGHLFCGDLLWNTSKPGLHSIVDDPAEMKASLEKLKNLKISLIHPGHGKPFSMELLLQANP
jgi:glyoxylase-like metal-dependent hydrolase (beta-lactamase superfamily II)